MVNFYFFLNAPSPTLTINIGLAINTLTTNSLLAVNTLPTNKACLIENENNGNYGIRVIASVSVFKVTFDNVNKIRYWRAHRLSTDHSG